MSINSNADNFLDDFAELPFDDVFDDAEGNLSFCHY
jgi:hypothetical protein